MKSISHYKDKNIEDYEIICFWKDYQKNGYLSNWYKVNFSVNGINYNCMEQFFMAEKARIFNDKKSWNNIMKATKPNHQKGIGRQVRNFDASIWDENKVKITIEGLRAKFTQNPDLKNRLLKTNDAILVEASPFDKIWGVGLSQKEVLKTNFKDWKGENLLGFALMKVRDEIIIKEKEEIK